MNLSKAYEVEKLPGDITVEVCVIDRVPVPGKEGKFRPQITRKMIKRPAGYMVHCARGHSFRVKDLAALEALGLNGESPLVDMESGQAVAIPRLSLRGAK